MSNKKENNIISTIIGAIAVTLLALFLINMCSCNSKSAINRKYVILLL